jgi:hypothetical protein
MAFLRADSSRYGEVQRALYQFKLVMEELGVAVLAQRHLNKSGVQKALYRGLESIAFVAVARTALLVAPDPASPERHRLLISNKSNLGPKPKALRFALDPVGPVCRVGWCGESAVNADEALAQETPDDRSAKQEAVALLAAMLRDGPRPAREILAVAKDLGISYTTLTRARRQLGVRIGQGQKGGHFDGSVWQLATGIPEPGAET